MDAKRFIMQLNEFKQVFFFDLSKLYATTEIQSFFNILIESKLNLTRVDVALSPTIKLNKEEFVYFQKALSNLKNSVPIQYIIGETSFYRLQFKVNNNVLIPRPETEELVEWIIKDSKNIPNIKILDIGTGSGCIAISLAKNLPNATVFALDVSEKALEIAQNNAKTNNVTVHFLKENILKINSLPDSFDIIVSNPPYVRDLEKKQIQKNVIDYEPHIALFVKNDNPLLFYKKISELAKTHLTQHGSLYFEINQYLGSETVALLADKGFKNIELKKDIFKVDRMIKALL